MKGKLSTFIKKEFYHVFRDRKTLLLLERQLLGAFGPEGLEESAEAGFRSTTSNPKQAAKALVDLIDDREVLLALVDSYFVDADGGDPFKMAARKAVVNHPPNSAIDDAPVGAEYFRDLAPRHPSCPPCEKQPEGIARAILAVGPGQKFHRDATPDTVDAPGEIPQKYDVAPYRNELKRSRLPACVVRWPSAHAFRTDRP